MSAETAPAAPEPVASNPVLREMAWERMNVRNENWVAAICGDTGSGKSWAALRIAQVLDPDFGIDQVAFGVEDFLRLVIDDSYGQGSVIVFEEASVEASHRQWWSKGNQVLQQVLDTWRHQNRGVIFTLPSFGKLDKAARGRCHALIQMTAKRPGIDQTVAKYKYLDTDSDSGKIYRHYPTVDGKKFQRIAINKPSKQIREPYEVAKENYTTELNRDLLTDLLEEQEDKQAQESDPKDIAEEIIESGQVEEYVSENNGVEYFDTDLVELDFDIGARKSKKVKKAILREVDLDVM